MLFLTPRKALSRSVGIKLRRTFANPLGVQPIVISRTQDIDSLPADGKPFIAVTHASVLLRRLVAQPTLLGKIGRAHV